MTLIHDEAMAAHARGWVLTPLRGKVPILDAWQSADPPRDTRVAGWCRCGNVGLRTGAVSGVFVIDVEAGGEPPALPATVTVETGGGGRHFYFKHPGNLGNTSRKLGPKIDTRGDGGQVVFVGSTHPDTGRVYAWAAGLSPTEIALADLPESVLAVLRPTSPSAARATNGTAWARKAVESEAARVRSASEGARNDTLNRAAFSLGQIVAGGALAESEVESVLLSAALEAGLSEKEARSTVRSGIRAGGKQPRRAPVPEDLRRNTSDNAMAPDVPRGTRYPGRRGQGQSVLVPGAHTLTGGEYREVSCADFADAVLSALPDGLLYRRACLAGELVGSPAAFRALMPDRARLLIDSNARLVRWSVKKGEDEPSCIFNPAERDHGHLMIAGAADSPRVRELEHLVSYPIFGSDWRLAPPGHSGTTYYDEPGDLAGLAPIRNGEEIRAVLEDLVADFPFASRSDLETWFGLLLTPLVRSAIAGNVPLHLVTAPIERTGKTKLAADVLGGIYLGHPTPTMQLTGSEDERDKRVLGLLLSGQRLVLLDNLSEFLDSSVVSSLLTSAHYQGRILGRTEVVSVPNAAVLVATGNNVRATGEIAKRTVPIVLRPSEERPEERVNFRHPDIAAHAIAQRRPVLGALIGMVLNWLALDRPRGALPFGGFDAWASCVGGVLAAHGFTSWLHAAQAWRSGSDDFSADLEALVRAWNHEPMLESPAGLMDLAKRCDLFQWVIGSKTTEKAQVTTFGLRVLRRADGRIVGDQRIESESFGSNRRYRLTSVVPGHVLEK